MKLGRTRVIKKAESTSARRRVSRHLRWRKIVAILVVGVVIVSLVALSALTVKEWLGRRRRDVAVKVEKIQPTAAVEIVDETGSMEISEKVKTYIGQIERDLADLGYTLIKVVLPANLTREIDLYLEDRSGYIKASLDRGTAVTAEDIDRMLKYLDNNGFGFEYLDVRIERKAYYK